MKETIELMQDMMDLQSNVAITENLLHNKRLSNKERAELEATQIYLLRHIRMAATILDTHIDVMMNTAHSRITDTTRKILNEMTFERATSNCVAVRSKAMQKIIRAIESDKLKSYRY